MKTLLKLLLLIAIDGNAGKTYRSCNSSTTYENFKISHSLNIRLFSNFDLCEDMPILNPGLIDFAL